MIIPPATPPTSNPSQPKMSLAFMLRSDAVTACFEMKARAQRARNCASGASASF